MCCLGGGRKYMGRQEKSTLRYDGAAVVTDISDNFDSELRKELIFRFFAK